MGPANDTRIKDPGPIILLFLWKKYFGYLEETIKLHAKAQQFFIPVEILPVINTDHANCFCTAYIPVVQSEE